MFTIESRLEHNLFAGFFLIFADANQKHSTRNTSVLDVCRTSL